MSKHSNEAVEGDDGGLVICRGCKVRGTYAEPPSGECPAPYKSDADLLAESLAREQALQQRLNAADQKIDELAQEREGLIAYGRSNGLDEASTVCSRMAYDTYYPAGSRFKHFVPKALEQQGNLLIKAANAIADLPDGPYERHRARQQKKTVKSATA
ncbi:hypothetical protein [Pseudomonas atacamensis]|uniref:hypothetical protein n=1 Tax=Pseudomonas atacamensis TaxID=2565368 RepID=UPI0019CFFE7B|nr:hypothetical protein [Pseudomonas atacamensis]QSL85984.1 hypothetical protein JWU58_17570 [Pseudomonas atacamensis]